MAGRGLMPSRPMMIEARFEWNLSGSQIVWSVWASDGTRASGFAKSHVDAMRDATAFVEAMAQPRVGGMGKQPGLRVIGED